MHRGWSAIYGKRDYRCFALFLVLHPSTKWEHPSTVKVKGVENCHRVNEKTHWTFIPLLSECPPFLDNWSQKLEPFLLAFGQSGKERNDVTEDMVYEKESRQCTWQDALTHGCKSSGNPAMKMDEKWRWGERARLVLISSSSRPEAHLKLNTA